MTRTIVNAALLFLMATSALPQEPASQTVKFPNPPPTVVSGAMPFYPVLARTARLEGEVRLRVKTDGEKAISVVSEQGQPLLAKAAADNVRTWRFSKHVPTEFSTTFVFQLVSQAGCEPLTESGRVVLSLPFRVEVTATATRNASCEAPSPSDPYAGLDLSEPLRVFLTKCEIDGASIPCDRVAITLVHNGEVIPKRFKEKGGREGFVVPAGFRDLDSFGARIKTPNGTFTVRDVHGSFLKGKWRIIVDHAPFQEEWRYLADGQSCIGIIHFQWSEPERLVTAACQ